MGAILLIEDDRNVQGLIEKIFPKSDLKVLKEISFGKETIPNQVLSLQETQGAAWEEVVREFIRGEIFAGYDGNIHEHIIGMVEKALIEVILEREKGNQVRAANRLGINRNTLRKKMKELQIITRVVTR